MDDNPSIKYLNPYGSPIDKNPNWRQDSRERRESRERNERKQSDIIYTPVYSNLFDTKNTAGVKKTFSSNGYNERVERVEKKKDMNNIYSAGVLPFYVKNKNIFFLLGKDPDGKWSDFGGRSEIGDEGRWDVTASREFYEETIGSIMDIQTIMTKLQAKKNHLKIKDKTLSGYPYYMYTIKIPYKDIYRYNFKSTFSFIKYTNSSEKKFDYKYLEKIDIQWISLEILKKSIDNENTEYPLRSVFKRTIEGNLDKIVEFCNTFNDYNFSDFVLE